MINMTDQTNSKSLKGDVHDQPPAYSDSEVYPPVYPPHEPSHASAARGEAPEIPSSQQANSAEQDQNPPGYFESAGWGDEFDHQTNFAASRTMRAVMFENQRWSVIGGEWGASMGSDRPAWSNGNGSRGVARRPSFTINKTWCVDRSEFPERCDEAGWTYGYSFSSLSDKDAYGAPAASTMMVVRRRKWMAPVPLSILQNVRNRSPSAESKGGKVVDNDDIVFDIVDTEEVAPEVTSSRRVAAHFNPASIERKGFLLFDMDKMWCDLKHKKLRVYADRKDAEPIKAIDLNDVESVKRGTGASAATFVITTTHNERYTFSGATPSETDGWYTDISNIVVAAKNWETAGQVGMAVGAAVAMVLVAGAVGAAGGRRHR